MTETKRPSETGRWALPIVHPDLRRLARQTADWLAGRGVVLSDVVVLVPYAQLMPLARQAWIEEVACGRAGLLPRFLSTQQWVREAQMVRPAPEAGQDWSPLASIAHVRARRMLAQTKLDQALSGQATSALTDILLQAAQALVPRVQAMAPDEREAWLRDMRRLRVWGFQAAGYDADAGERSEQPALEPTLLRIALEWVGLSRFDTDVLWEPEVHCATSALVVWQGLQEAGLSQALAAHWGDAALVLPWPEPQAESSLATRVMSAAVRRFEAHDAEHEALQASACVIRHLQAGARQLAVVALDRALVRRMRALLAARGVRVHDETGWKLSTTHAATQIMSWLVAARHGATTHEVLDAVVMLPDASTSVVRQLEQWLAQTRHFTWPSDIFFEAPQNPEYMESSELGRRISRWRLQLQGRRSLNDWLGNLRDVFAQMGLMDRLEQDEAGQAVLRALHMDDPCGWIRAHPDLACDGFSLGDVTAWIRSVLEAGSFVAERPTDAQDEPVVSLIPLSQVLGRNWDALVLPGCDEVHLPWCPGQTHAWTGSQCDRLGLVPDEERIRMQQRAWSQALAVPCVDVFRRRHEQAESISASPLLRRTLHTLRQQGHDWPLQTASPLALQRITATETDEPMPSWEHGKLAQSAKLRHLSPSAYEDLRSCPYRFHAHRLLGLREEDEITQETDKRDWGNWVHRVLHRFHAQRREGLLLEAQLDEAANDVAAQMRLDGAAFLPFRMAWPDLRDAYARWLRAWERDQATFERAEAEARVRIDEADITLVGRIDRIDRLPDGALQLLDYKTESLEKTKKRASEPLEDVQLAFYALLIGQGAALEGMQAAYLNLPESGETRLGVRRSPTIKEVPLPNLAEQAGALRQGIGSDLQRVRAGHALRALGDGPVCEHCDVRGLCRRDFWRHA